MKQSGRCWNLSRMQMVLESPEEAYRMEVGVLGLMNKVDLEMRILLRNTKVSLGATRPVTSLRTPNKQGMVYANQLLQC